MNDSYSADHVKYIMGDINVYWINLDRSTDRKEILEKTLIECNINNTRISAIDGKKINREDFQEKYNFATTVSLNEMACAMSHYKAIQTAYDNNDEYAIIMEDDCNFEYLKFKTKPILTLFNEMRCIGGECLQLGLTCVKNTFNAMTSSTNEIFKGMDAGAIIYILSREAMKKILDRMNDKNSTKSVSEDNIFKTVKNYVAKPYFTYYFRDIVKSTIREPTKAAHATQTLSKIRWDNYYNNLIN